jgi:hypothetical protein
MPKIKKNQTITKTDRFIKVSFFWASNLLFWHSLICEIFVKYIHYFEADKGCLRNKNTIIHW